MAGYTEPPRTPEEYRERRNTAIGGAVVFTLVVNVLIGILWSGLLGIDGPWQGYLLGNLVFVPCAYVYCLRLVKIKRFSYEEDQGGYHDGPAAATRNEPQPTAGATTREPKSAAAMRMSRTEPKSGRDISHR